MRRFSRYAQLTAYLAFLLGAGYVIADTIYVRILQSDRLNPEAYLWFIEDNGRGAVHFDPISGLRLDSAPAHQALITQGEIEYIGTFQGNNLGFPDRDNFGPKRTSDAFRVAVLGDSYTAGTFLMRNWPDAAEAFAREKGLSIELLNFSFDGIGLANWWSMLTRILEKDDYKIDGILFPVFFDDISRKFQIADQSDRKSHKNGYLEATDPQQWPRTLEEARPQLHDLGTILSTKEFYETLQGRFSPHMPRIVKHHLYEWTRTVIWKKAYADELGITFEPWQDQFIKEIAACCARHHWPVMVVPIPYLGKETMTPGIQKFSDRLGATLVPGGKPFEGLSDEELKNYRFPRDGHWNQLGSDRFAHYMVDVLTGWKESLRTQQK